ncbi:ras guanine nucleotide exchange factor F [Callorhinchus milii]|uniref:Host cell factor 2-like n=1 Tax=Callorhinchus milii TaxID=7868 RepID=A0A4W3II57_CALMI|nr:ras guanine nucleotide exchange factor F [Callorhinchus milii]|eukprot:gi/632957587/ref/XP_007894559.1/ PREDICTED: host cell factor 2-like [Callorhinchus milii]
MPARANPPRSNFLRHLSSVLGWEGTWWPAVRCLSEQYLDVTASSRIMDIGLSAWRQLPQCGPAPEERCKHACCVFKGYMYLFGGRRQNGLKDFWRYSVVQNKWEKLDQAEGTAPEELEEPSLVAHEGVLYVFGGMMDSAYTQGKTPLWMYDIGASRWTHWHKLSSTDTEKQAPINRREHSAVVFEAKMYIYGGYVDIKGPSQEFWSFTFELEEWRPVLSSSAEISPGPRYSHSAIVYRTGMYLFGGLVGLMEQSDFWRWDFDSNTWSRIKARCGPQQLVGHSAVVYQDSMLIFGGGRNHKSADNSLWKFQLTTRSWERLTPATDRAPPARIYHCTIGAGPGFSPAARGLPTASTNGPPEEPDRSPIHPPLPDDHDDDSGIEMTTFRMCSGPPPEEGPAQADLGEPGGPPPPTDSLPEVLLVVGGKPLSEHKFISMWQMKLCERFLKS